jgi:hypothetical protein
LRREPVTTIASSSSFACAYAALPGTGASALASEPSDGGAAVTAVAADGEKGTSTAAAVDKNILLIMKRPADWEVWL